VREEIRIERQVRLENFLDKIKASTPTPHQVKRWTKTLIELYLGHLRAEDPEWPHSKMSAKDIYDGYLHMYVHTPVALRAAEALKAADDENNELVKELLRKLMSSEEGQAIQSEIQTIHRSKRVKNKKFHALLELIYKNDPSINDHRLLQNLKKEVGKGVIRSIDERNNKIYIQGGGEFAITGLKDHLTNMRKFR
jgi:mannose/cellobiose epimerase-like protein (N-acyl-D-glucosamine 2-epimerase family)